jgi:hypothetical protein
MRARTIKPKFLAQVTEPQAFVNASYQRTDGTEYVLEWHGEKARVR